MARLTPPLLNRAFIAALGSAVTSVVDPDSRILELELAPPLKERVRAYVYNATNPPGGRPGREHKVQLIVPGQVRGAAGNFDRSGGYDVLLAGKVTDEDAFVLWDATLYRNFGYSANVQVNSDEVNAALAGHRIVAWHKDTRNGPEEVLIAPSDLLRDAVLRRLGVRTSAPGLAPRSPLGIRPLPSTAGTPSVRATSSGTSGGTTYVRASLPERESEPASRVFEFDPDALDRGTRAHMTLQDRLADTFLEVGVEPLSPAAGDPEFDLACRDGDMVYVIEVKSLTPTNEEKQLRLGLGQVLSYAYRIKRAWGVGSVQPVLAVEHAPQEEYWPGLCDEYGVVLTWPDDFPGLF